MLRVGVSSCSGVVKFSAAGSPNALSASGVSTENESCVIVPSTVSKSMVRIQPPPAVGSSWVS